MTLANVMNGIDIYYYVRPHALDLVAQWPTAICTTSPVVKLGGLGKEAS
jgi:hypothetical protein